MKERGVKSSGEFGGGYEKLFGERAGGGKVEEVGVFEGRLDGWKDGLVEDGGVGLQELDAK